MSARLRPGDRLDDLEHIGIDDPSCRQHHGYISVVVNHATGRIV